jgi:hypothetical protein
VLPWLVLLVIAAAGAGVIWKLSPGGRGDAPSPAALAPPAAQPGVNLDSIAQVERRMQDEIATARRTAMLAERRADSIAAANRATGAAVSRESAHGHVYVFAQGGTPQVVIDGQIQRGVTPQLLQLAPGRHQVAVRGLTPYAPADTTIELAAEDTQTVVFRATRRAAGPLPGATFPAGAPKPKLSPVPGNDFFLQDPETGQTTPNWPVITQKLGFDPRTADPRRLTPQQRLAFRRYQQMVDSARRAAGRKP